MTGAPDSERWHDAVQEPFDIQADCQVWPDNLPEALKDSTLAEQSVGGVGARPFPWTRCCRRRASGVTVQARSAHHYLGLALPW
jgi:hypothetical protein